MDDKDKGSLAMEMVGEINTKSPAYLNVIREPRDDSEEVRENNNVKVISTAFLTRLHRRFVRPLTPIISCVIHNSCG